MSTRGIIAIEKPDKTCRAVYVHFDMCLDSAGICLTQHYTAPEMYDMLAFILEFVEHGGNEGEIRECYAEAIAKILRKARGEE